MMRVMLEMGEETAVEVRRALEAHVRFNGHGAAARIVNVINALEHASVSPVPCGEIEVEDTEPG